ncbi:MAG TPA: tetratricopeptide repeat protein [Devosia sp.]
MARQPASKIATKPTRQRAAAKPAVPPKKERVRLTHVEAASTRLRTVLLNFAFVAAFLVIVPVIVSQFWRNEVMIMPVPVPEALADVGLTPEVAANRIWDGIRDATLRANTSKSTVTALPDAQRIEFSLPESGFSMESLIQQTRAFFHAYQTRISGEFTCSDPACDPKGMRLRLRVLRDTAKLIDLPPIGDTPLRDYFTAAGVQVLTVLDPFVAIASIADTEPQRATVLAQNLIRQHHPDAKWAHVLIGIMKSKDSDLDSSIAEFREALKLDPDFFIARRNLAMRLVTAKRLDEANAEFAVLSKKWPNDPEITAGLGELAYAQQRYDEAGLLYARAEALDPRQPLYVARRGDAALAKGDAETGIAELQRALRMDPSFAPAMGSLTAYYFNKGDFSAAAPLLADYAEIEPDNAQAQTMYGQVLRLSGDNETALVHLSKALDLEPRNLEVADMVAGTYMSLGDLPKAEQVYQQMALTDPKRAETFAALGTVNSFMTRFDASLENWRKAAALEPENAVYAAGIGESLMYARRYNEALAQFEAAEALDPKRPETWSFKGATLKYLGRNAEAIAALKTFLDLSDGKMFYGPLREIAEGDIATLEAEAQP